MNKYEELEQAENDILNGLNKIAEGFDLLTRGWERLENNKMLNLFMSHNIQEKICITVRDASCQSWDEAFRTMEEASEEIGSKFEDMKKDFFESKIEEYHDNILCKGDMDKINNHLTELSQNEVLKLYDNMIDTLQDWKNILEENLNRP